MDDFAALAGFFQREGREDPTFDSLPPLNEQVYALMAAELAGEPGGENV
jgi:hypothetical protein